MIQDRKYFSEGTWWKDVLSLNDPVKSLCIFPCWSNLFGQNIFRGSNSMCHIYIFAIIDFNKKISWCGKSENVRKCKKFFCLSVINRITKRIYSLWSEIPKKGSGKNPILNGKILKPFRKFMIMRKKELLFYLPNIKKLKIIFLEWIFWEYMKLLHMPLFNLSII